MTSTTFTLAGYRIVRSLGVVRGVTVRSRSLFGTIGAKIETLFGGQIALLTTLCERAREDAFDILLAHAQHQGANAVVGVRCDAAETMSGETPRMRDMYLRSAVCLSVIASWACSPGVKARAPDWTRVPVSLELRLAEGSPAPGLVAAAVYGQGKTVYLHPEAQLSNGDIVRVEAVKTRIGKGLILQIWLTRAGASRLKEATGRHIGDSLAVLIDSVVVAVPVIQQPIGRDPKLPFDIGVPLEPEETQRLAAAVSKTWPAAKSAP